MDTLRSRRGASAQICSPIVSIASSLSVKKKIGASRNRRPRSGGQDVKAAVPYNELRGRWEKRGVKKCVFREAEIRACDTRT